MKITKITNFVFMIGALVGLAGCDKANFDVGRADSFSRVSRRSAQAAIRLYQGALRAHPSGVFADSVRLKLGRMYLEAGSFGDAAAEFRMAVSSEAQRLLARALLKNADYTEALEVFNRIGDQSDDDAYLFDYALAAEKSHLYDQALRLYAGIGKDPLWASRAQERIRAISLDSGKGSFAGVDADVRKMIEESPQQQDHPDASGVYLFIDEDIRLTDDNREISEIHYVVKILNDRGKEKFGEVSLAYDSTYEKLELEYARTIKPDGTVVTVGDKNIRDVSVYLNYPLYSNARARIISMPEVASGSVIEYKARLTRSQLPNRKDFDTTYWLQADEPIAFQRSRIRVPKGRDLKYKIVNAAYNTFGFDMTPAVREENNEKVYSLEFRNVPQIVPEPGMPSWSRVNPYILFSTFDDWQDIYTWWQGLYKDKIVVDEEIRGKVRELTRGKLTDEEKIRAIYNFCAQDIRYVAVEYGEAGYEPHRASEIFRNKYGDCKDKAILLVTMLQGAGIEAFPVLISTFDALDLQEDTPNLLFNHAIAAVEIGGEPVFMDATGPTVSWRDLPVGDQGRMTLVFFKDKYGLRRTPLFASEHNKIATTMKIVVNADESITAERQVDARGFYQQAQRSWLKFTMPTLIEEDMGRKARTIAPGAVLKNYVIKNVDDMDKPILFSYTFAAPQYLRKAGSTRVMDPLGGADVSWVVKESRRYPMEFDALQAEATTIEVELPAHLAVKYLPKPAQAQTKWFDFSNRYEKIGKNVVRFTSLARTKTRDISAQEYPAYKKALEATAFSSDQQVIIEEKR
jgi:transglutaminase-like putative cysteine protease